MSTTRTQKIVTAILVVYLILSPIVIGVSIYKWVTYKKWCDVYTEATYKDIDKMVAEEFKDIKPIEKK